MGLLALHKKSSIMSIELLESRMKECRQVRNALKKEKKTDLRHFATRVHRRIETPCWDWAISLVLSAGAGTIAGCDVGASPGPYPHEFGPTDRWSRYSALSPAGDITALETLHKKSSSMTIELLQRRMKNVTKSRKALKREKRTYEIMRREIIAIQCAMHVFSFWLTCVLMS